MAEHEGATSGTTSRLVETGPDRMHTGWERVAHRLPDEIESLVAAFEKLTDRLSPFLVEPTSPSALQEVGMTPSGASAIVHAEEQIDRLRDLRSRIGSVLDRLDI